jgi:hypothetical protein
MTPAVHLKPMPRALVIEIGNGHTLTAWRGRPSCFEYRLSDPSVVEVNGHLPGVKQRDFVVRALLDAGFVERGDKMLFATGHFDKPFAVTLTNASYAWLLENVRSREVAAGKPARKRDHQETTTTSDTTTNTPPTGGAPLQPGTAGPLPVTAETIKAA